MQIIKRKEGIKKRLLPQIEINAEPYKHKNVEARVATFDTETDPFAPGRVVKPFTCGLYLTDTQEYFDFWGDDCIQQFILFLSTNFEPGELAIFVHNGGNFDFYFLLDYFVKGHSPFIINGRLVRVEICDQEFRDSYAMIPVALGAYDKDAIDYRCMERGFREIFKVKIREYQKRDCTALAELVTNWLDMFGNKKTMASVALPMLRSYQGFETLSEHTDKEMRPYYFGGRNQCFATGIIKGDWKIYDINSSYPNVMRRYNHPISDKPIFEPRITSRTHFAYIRAWSLGALPVRTKTGALNFPIGTYDFYACIHEIKAGLETKTLKIKKVYHSIYFEQEANFAPFIDTYYDLRMQASAQGDEIRKLFYKLVMNSSYGKFAQDPRKYENWLFDPVEIPTPFHCAECFDKISKGEYKEKCKLCSEGTTDPYGWYLHTTREGTYIYASPQRVRNGSFFNVATAASITSAARAELLRGIQAATRPVYCDTDSVICEHLESTSDNGIILDEKLLGAWKPESMGDSLAIAGKKLYALFCEGEPIKKASKGVRLTADEILRVANGETIEYPSLVPKFKLDGSAQFVTRSINATA